MSIDSLEFQNLSFGYQIGQSILLNVSFTFPVRGCVNFTGVTGAGKNTIFRILSGLEFPVDGRYLVNGISIAEASQSARYELFKQMGVGFSQGGLLQNRSLEENLALALSALTALSARECQKRLDEYLERFDLLAARSERPSQVSGGMRMACCLARAFIHHPSMVLLSHPTSGISPQVYEALFLLINQHKKDLGLSGIYMITEDEKFEEKLACDRILVRSGNLHFESKQRYEEVA